MKSSNKKYVEKYRTEMITATFHQYVRNLPISVLREFERIAEEESGKTVKTNFGCSHCVLKLVKQVGKIYFKDYPDEIPEELKNRL